MERTIGRINFHACLRPGGCDTPAKTERKFRLIPGVPLSASWNPGELSSRATGDRAGIDLGVFSSTRDCFKKVYSALFPFTAEVGGAAKLAVVSSAL